MPFVRIELLEGRTLEQKTALVQEVTEVVAKHTNASKDSIFVILNELEKGTQLAQAGEFK